MRSAESQRNSSCTFADEIARLSIDHFKTLAPQSLLDSLNQTVISTFILQLSSPDKDHYELEVVSIGMGTKVLSFNTILEQKSADNLEDAGDKIVRDHHAEVLARRSFLRFMYQEIFLLYTKYQETGARSTKYLHLNKDLNVEFNEGIRIHMYSSSQPCGNACIKKWAKGRKPVFTEVFERSIGYPVIPHERIHVTARADGEVALLCKRNRGENIPQASESVESPVRPLKIQKMSSKEEGKGGSTIPAGTVSASSSDGNVMTCSDKIAKWNAIGLQGSLLLYLFPTQLSLSSVTVGRKFSEVHARRALCCRLQNFNYPLSLLELEFNTKQKGEECRIEGFSIKHPMMFGTSVKFDESVIITGSSVQEKPTQLLAESSTFLGAQFNEFRSFCGWLGFSEDTGCYEFFSEILDSKTGFLYCDNTDSSNLSTIENQISLISSFSFACSCVQLLKRKNKISNVGITEFQDEEEKIDSFSYKGLKRGNIPLNNRDGKIDNRSVLGYNEAKKELFENPKFFKGWVDKQELIKNLKPEK